MFSAVLSPRLLLVTMSEGETLSLWSSSTGELKSQTHVSGLQGETPTSSALIQRQGRMTVGFSGGSLSVVHIYLFNFLTQFLTFLIISGGLMSQTTDVVA